MMQRLSRSLSRFETQDIKTQPQFNHYLESLLAVELDGWSMVEFLLAAIRLTTATKKFTNRYLLHA